MEQPTQKATLYLYTNCFITIYEHSLQKPTYCGDIQEEMSWKQSVNICDELQERHTWCFITKGNMSRILRCHRQRSCCVLCLLHSLSFFFFSPLSFGEWNNYQHENSFCGSEVIDFMHFNLFQSHIWHMALHHNPMPPYLYGPITQQLAATHTLAHVGHSK